MNRLDTRALAFTFALATTASSFAASPHVGTTEPLAFPGAEGYGAHALGGRGGRALAVTHTGDSGPGSLRACVEASGRRTCVFRVGGTIDLESDLEIREPYLTIAGQTAPGGIQLRGRGLRLVVLGGAHDVVIRHLRVRPGAPAPDDDGGNNIVITGDNGPVWNVVVDHCSMQWGNDEMASTWALVRDVTWQWNLIAEGSPAPPGVSFGFLSGGPGAQHQTLSLHHNLFAHNGHRNPRVSRAGLADIRNNLIYNWGSTNPPDFTGHFAFELGDTPFDHTARANFVNNHYLAGPNSVTEHFLLLANGGADRERGGTKVYAAGNWAPSSRCLVHVSWQPRGALRSDRIRVGT